MTEVQGAAEWHLARCSWRDVLKKPRHLNEVIHVVKVIFVNLSVPVL